MQDNKCGDKLAQALNGKKIDILINNAGYFYEPVEKIDSLNFEEVSHNPFGGCFFFNFVLAVILLVFIWYDISYFYIYFSFNFCCFMLFNYCVSVKRNDSFQPWIIPTIQNALFDIYFLWNIQLYVFIIWHVYLYLFCRYWSIFDIFINHYRAAIINDN